MNIEATTGATTGATASRGRLSLDSVGMQDWARVRAALVEGYPGVPSALWDQGEQRLRRVPVPLAEPGLGRLLIEDGRTVGVALTFAQRPTLEGPGHVLPPAQVNLSSWAILPQSRRHAAWMVREVVNDPGHAYTCMTPITATTRFLQRAGFQVASHQLILISTLAHLRGRDEPGVRVLDAKATLEAVRGQPIERALEDHLRLDCMVWGLQTPVGVEPLVLRKLRRMRLPLAEVLYAPSQKSLARHAGTLARHALRTGHAFLEFEGHEDLDTSFRCMRIFRRRLARGPYTARGIDHLYSEFVYLHR